MQVVNRLRQGDMLLYRLSDAEAAKIKASAAKKVEMETLVVGEGEVTGHSHDVLSVGNLENDTKTKITAYLAENESLDNLSAITNLFFELENEMGVIVHDEHNPILLEKGFYARVIQREFNPFTSMYQQVRD